MGELIARAVYAGVQEAVHKQNGVVTGRSVFQRLKERKVDLSSLSRHFAGKDGNARSLRTQVEQLLLEPKYAGFITALMAVADDAGKGLVQDSAGVDLWCRNIAAEIAGKPVNLLEPMKSETEEQTEDALPPVLAKGLTALFSGVAAR
ncbi:MAG: hypothetical protein D3904_12905 [Candidatus Electrothrix sp. EH2]|nr:hypothetical protein [Candidatus Electrothrix sp. EH2]